MKAGLYKILSRIIIVAFILFWIVSSVFSVSTSTPNDKLGKAFPKLNRTFSHTWSLFYRSFDINDELYLILRDRNTKQITDSFRLMGENFALKSKTAPFNQHYYIIDRILSHYVTATKSKEVRFRNELKKDSLFEQNLQKLREKDIAYQTGIRTLRNYCLYVLMQKKIDTTGKEYKIVIRTTHIKRFGQRNDPNCFPKESLYYQSDYTSF